MKVGDVVIIVEMDNYKRDFVESIGPLPIEAPVIEIYGEDIQVEVQGHKIELYNWQYKLKEE